MGLSDEPKEKKSQMACLSLYSFLCDVFCALAVMHVPFSEAEQQHCLYENRLPLPCKTTSHRILCCALSISQPRSRCMPPVWKDQRGVA